MKKGEKIRAHVGQDSHGHGGFIAIGTVIDENDHLLLVSPEAFLLIKNEVGSLEELPDDAVVEDALRTVQVGRESYLGKTVPLLVQSVAIDPLED